MYRILLILCLLLAFPAFADDTDGPIALLLKGNNLQESDCPELVRFLNNQSVSKQERHEDAPITVALSYHILVLGCPMRFMTTPINALHRSEISETREDVSVSLGAAYEYGVRVTRDLDEARHWYRKLAYRLIGKPEIYLKFTRQRIAQINPVYRSMSSEDWSTALNKGALASEIFEEEFLAVQNLMNGPVSGIVQASEHLYRGTGGFPRDKEIAQRILHDSAQKGFAEAQYAFAQGLLDQRFDPLILGAASTRAEAQHYLVMAAAKRYVPALLKLAELCEGNTILTAETAMAFYRIAADHGAQIAADNLRRLHAEYPDAEAHWIDKAADDIEAGHLPPCR